MLGISGDYHDAAAALVIDGQVVAAAEEERFTRIKHDPSLPRHAIAWCLESAGVEPGGLDHVVFYEKPLTAYERLLVTHGRVGPRGFPSFARGVWSWSRSKLWVAYRLERLLGQLGHRDVRVEFAEHHQSHAASAYFPSPFDRAAVLVLDGVGEWATCTIGHGRGRDLELIEEVHFPASLGLLYSALTSFCGFDVNDGEYKLMGLAPYGEPTYERALLDHAIHLNADGSFELDHRYFDFQAGRRMYHPRLGDLLDGPALAPGAPLTQREADIARSIQTVLEQAIEGLVRRAVQLTGERSLCLAGGVALNCVATARLREVGAVDDLWVQPAAGDAGGAVGAALWHWHQTLDQDRAPAAVRSERSSVFLGPAFDDHEIIDWLEEIDVPHQTFETTDGLCEELATALDAGQTIGWFQGEMEFGPRALGHRSILADPRPGAMARTVNLSIKRREPFRPFAPAVLQDHAGEWFDLTTPLPHMTEIATVSAAHRRPGADDQRGSDDFGARLAVERSDIAACTHVDHSARVQTVDDRNERFHQLLSAFHQRTGCPVLLNTSFNRAGEPIVRTPADALRCFDDTDLDLLVLGRCILRKDGDRTLAGTSVGAP